MRFRMSMDSGKLREKADIAVGSLNQSVTAFRRTNELWADYVRAAFPGSDKTLSEAVFGGSQMLVEIEAHLGSCDALLDTAEENASLVVNKDRSNLSALGLMHGVEAGKRGVLENRQAIGTIQEQPPQFETLSAALNHMTNLAVQQTFRNDIIVGEMQLGIQHGQKYIPTI